MFQQEVWVNFILILPRDYLLLGIWVDAQRQEKEFEKFVSLKML